tara:strand:+ start:1823 stop:1972 length:150 start_codon:yes stop_codon:yes gene_type:complete
MNRKKNDIIKLKNSSLGMKKPIKKYRIKDENNKRPNDNVFFININFLIS